MNVRPHPSGRHDAKPPRVALAAGVTHRRVATSWVAKRTRRQRAGARRKEP